MATELLLYTDFVCPYCFIAERTSVERLAKEFDIAIEWRGFQLRPQTPEGGEDMRKAFGPRADGMRQGVIEFAKSFGVEGLNPPSRIPNTRPALAVAEYARDHGKLPEFRRATMDAHWIDGLDIETPEVLRQLAVGVGLDGDGAVAAAKDPRFLGRIEETRAEAGDVGVTGIPTCVVGDAAVVGCQKYGAFVQLMEYNRVERRH